MPAARPRAELGWCGGGGPHGWAGPGWVHAPGARPSPPSLPQRPPAVHLRQSVPAGCEGHLLGPAGLRPVLDGAPHRQPGPVAARRPILPAAGVLGPAGPIGRTKEPPQLRGRLWLLPMPAEGAGWPRGARLPPATHPNKGSFNCSERRLPPLPRRFTGLVGIRPGSGAELCPAP